MSEVVVKSNLDVWADKLPVGSMEWLKYAARGCSSETMFTVLTGYPLRDQSDFDAPFDGSDLCRCRILMAMVPSLKPRLVEMKKVSPVWSALVDHWDELEALVDSETRWFDGDRTGAAPLTIARMRDLEISAGGTRGGRY